MNGEFIVNGISSTSMGVYLLENSYASLLSYPPLKEPLQNSWAEEDGMEVDLSTPRLDAIVRKLNFFSSFGNADEFLNSLLSTSQSTFYFPDLGLNVTLRYMDCQSFECRSGAEFSLTFSEDVPLDGYEYTPPYWLMVGSQSVSIDGVDISAYGIQLLENSLSSIRRAPAAKDVTTINSLYLHGVQSDYTKLYRKAKEVILSLFLRTEYAYQFLTNYYAFLHDLILPKERELGIDGRTYKCYYKRSEIKHFTLENAVWCEFDVVFCFT
jgi:hypothetical protein